MKKVIIYVFLSICILSSSIEGQNSNDKVTLRFNKVQLKTALQKLAKQTNITFIYGDSLIQDIYVNDDFMDTPCDTVIKRILQSTNLTFKHLKNGQIIIFKKNKSRRNSLAGYIVDSETSEALPYANISLVGSRKGSTTNEVGYFALLDLTDKETMLRFQHVGYNTKDISMDTIETNSKVMLVKMEQSTLAGEKISVESDNPRMLEISKNVSQLSISPYYNSDLPIIGDKDISRSLQLLPGITSGNFGSSGLNIRGGLPSQNLILLDGMKLYHINHLFGFFSAFNSNVIKDTRIYKGGQPAKYGDRLSGVIKLTSKTGDLNRPRLNISLSQAISGAVLELPIWGRGSILLSARRSYSDFIYGSLYDQINRTLYTKKVDPQGVITDSISNIETNSKLYFYDIHSKLTLLPTERDIISFSYFKGLDHLNSTEVLNGYLDDFKKTKSIWSNTGYSIKWYRQWFENINSSLLFSQSKYYTDYSNSDKKYLFYYYNPAYNDTVFIRTDIMNSLKNISTEFENTWILNKNHTMEFGINSSWTDIGFDLDNEYLVDENFEHREFSSANDLDKSTVYSAYVQDSWQFNTKFYIVSGSRINQFQPLDRFFWEPRLSIKYSVTPQFNLSGAWGKYYQYVMQYGDGNQVLDGKISWITADGSTIHPGSANHFILGADYEFNDFQFNSEIYYKQVNGILDEPNEWQYLDASLLSRQIKGFTYGVDLILQKRKGMFIGWMSYAYSRSNNEISYNNKKKTFPASQDCPHNINLTCNYKLRNFNVSLNWHFASGRPYSIPVIKSKSVGNTDNTYLYLHPPEERNKHRLPTSHQLDFNFNYNFNYDFVSGKLGLSVFDVYNNRNVWYVDYILNEDKLEKVEVRMFGITPTFFMELHF